MTKEEAIEVYNGLINEKIKEAFEVFAPELAESDDERTRKEIISALRFANYDGVYDKHIAYLEKQKEQKPEWSEKDEIVYESIQTILLAEARFVEERKWFDSIKARIKSTCWDEKDEKMCDRLIDRLQFITLNTRTDSTSPNVTFFDEIDWLKSLKNRGNFPKSNTNSPSWKPSEEQMYCLEEIIAFKNLEPEVIKGCESLYNELKKLKED